MKVAIVTDFLIKMGGAERVVKQLADLYPDAPIYTLLYDEEKCGCDFPAKRVRTSFLQRLPKWLRRRYRYFLGWMPLAIETLDLMQYDLVISSSSAFAHGVLTNSSSLHICYCHSPMRYAWDYTHRYFSEQPEGWFKKWWARKALYKVRMWDKVAADRPDVYIANSKHVQRRIEKFYRLPAEVIYPGVDVNRFELGGEAGEYYLIISTLTPYKKIDLAVNLFNKTGKKLIIIGGGREEDYLRRIAGPNVTIKGRLSDDETRQYLEGCKAVIFPAEEDFGIVPVEAMACGKPVLAFGVGGALETVIPGETGELFAEQTLASIEDGLGRLITNYKKYQPEKIRKHAEKFAAQHFEKEVKQLIEQKVKEFKLK